MPEKIFLTKEEMDMCRVFAANSKNVHERIEFCEKTTAPRCDAETEHDILVGKIAEVAAQRMFKKYCGIYLPVDFGIYDDRGDECDLSYNGYRFDIKGTSVGYNFLMNILQLKRKLQQEDLPHFFLLFNVEGKEHPTGEVIYRGAASIYSLSPEFNPDCVFLARGDCIPGTSTHLQADNFCIPFSRLNADFGALCSHIGNMHPTSNFMDKYVSWFEQFCARKMPYAS